MMDIFSKKKFSAGFTLIELLVVIAIISLLSSVVFASLSSAREKARDAKRLAELRQFTIATELYYNNNNIYPSATTSYMYAVVGLTPTYIPALPIDPTRTGGNRYRYWYSNRSLGYTILVQLEANGNTWCKIVIGTSGYSSWDTQLDCY